MRSNIAIIALLAGQGVARAFEKREVVTVTSITHKTVTVPYPGPTTHTYAPLPVAPINSGIEVPPAMTRTLTFTAHPSAHASGEKTTTVTPKVSLSFPSSTGNSSHKPASPSTTHQTPRPSEHPSAQTTPKAETPVLPPGIAAPHTPILPPGIAAPHTPILPPGIAAPRSTTHPLPQLTTLTSARTGATGSPLVVNPAPVHTTAKPSIPSTTIIVHPLPPLTSAKQPSSPSPKPSTPVNPFPLPTQSTKTSEGAPKQTTAPQVFPYPSAKAGVTAASQKLPGVCPFDLPCYY